MNVCRDDWDDCREMRWSEPGWNHGARETLIFAVPIMPPEGLLVMRTRVVERVRYGCGACHVRWDHISDRCTSKHDGCVWRRCIRADGVAWHDYVIAMSRRARRNFEAPAEVYLPALGRA